LLTLLGLVAYLSRETERPWETMPVYRSVPVGDPVRIKFALEPGWNIRVPLVIELNRLEFEPAVAAGRSSGRGRIEAGDVDLVPAGRASNDRWPAQYRLKLQSYELSFQEMPAALSGWEDWATAALDTLSDRYSDRRKSFALRGTLVRMLRRVSGHPFRMGEAFGVEAASDRGGRFFPSLADHGKWQGWLGYSVERADRVYIRLKLEGGLRWDLPELDPAASSRSSLRSFFTGWWTGGRTGRPPDSSTLAKLATAALLRPFGTIHRIHARLSGGFTADHRSGLPARAAVQIEFRIRGVRDGQPYLFRGELVVRTLDWIRFQPR